MGRRGGVVMCSYFEQKFVYMAYDAGSWCIFRLFQAGIFCRAPEIPQYRSWRSTDPGAVPACRTMTWQTRRPVPTSLALESGFDLFPLKLPHAPSLETAFPSISLACLPVALEHPRDRGGIPCGRLPCHDLATFHSPVPTTARALDPQTVSCCYFHCRFAAKADGLGPASTLIQFDQQVTAPRPSFPAQQPRNVRATPLGEYTDCQRA